MTKPPTDKFSRVVRGGAWYVRSAAESRAKYRYVVTPSYRENYVGFRCAQRGARKILAVGT